MPEKHKVDIEFVYPNGYFELYSLRDPLQIYHVCEREIITKRNIDKPVCKKKSYFFLFCLTGKGVLNTTDGQIPFEKNAACVLSADLACTLIPSSDGLRYVCINFSVLERYLEAGEDPVFQNLLKVPSAPNDILCLSEATGVKRFISRFIAEMCLPKPTSRLVQGLFYQSIIAFYRSIASDTDDTVDEKPSLHAVGHTVYAIIRYIDDNLYSMNHLMSMAKELGYSYNYLSHLFRRKTGMTIQEYVSKKKIERSKELLQRPELSITKIASMLNYDCIQSFSKAFKRATGVSPTEYRSKLGIAHCEEE